MTEQKSIDASLNQIMNNLADKKALNSTIQKVEVKEKVLNPIVPKVELTFNNCTFNLMAPPSFSLSHLDPFQIGAGSDIFVRAQAKAQTKARKRARTQTQVQNQAQNEVQNQVQNQNGIETQTNVQSGSQAQSQPQNSISVFSTLS